MLPPQRKRPVSSKPRAKTASVPAPVGGWNNRDSLAGMKPTDAVALVNWFPRPTMVEVRYGHSRHATGIVGQVETLMSYAGGATNKLKAVANGSVYDVSAAGAVGAAELSSLTNSRWQYINISTAGGNFIEMCNGADGVYTYNGTTWTDQSGSITGVTAANLIHINQHKNRVWFIEKDTLKAWYLPTGSITGAANALDLRAFCTRGGYLMAMATWTVDAGYGVDDLAVFITSQGEALVYRGTDPSSATTWALVGVYYIGSPIGRRCFIKYGGDCLVITYDGVVPLSGALQSSRTNPKVTLTDKIQFQIGAAISSYAANYGWQLQHFPKEEMLILNVPVQVGDVQEQYVMNTLTGAWADFRGWDANCWELFNDHIYFGSNTFVGKAWDTNADNGDTITFSALQAFSEFGNPMEKQFTMMRPTFLTNGTPSIQGSINVDFDTSAPSSSLSTAPISSGSLWDSGAWDTALWADTLSLSRLWQGATGIGKWGAPRVAGTVDGQQLQWINTEIIAVPSPRGVL